jgi:hypothetical protein
MKSKQNKKEAKPTIIFTFRRNEAKRKQNFLHFNAKKSVFSLVFASEAK